MDILLHCITNECATVTELAGLAIKASRLAAFSIKSNSLSNPLLMRITLIAKSCPRFSNSKALSEEENKSEVFRAQKNQLEKQKDQKKNNF